MTHLPPGLEPVDDLTAADWVRVALRDWPKGRPFIVSDLVPPVFEAYARIFHRPYRPADGRIPTGTWGERAKELGREFGPTTTWAELRRPDSGEGQGDDWKPGRDGDLTEHEAETLASLLSGYTMTPLECWFAMWSGWGDLSGASGMLYASPRGTIASLRMQWRNWMEDWKGRRKAARLKTFPLLGQSGRSYVLIEGAVGDAARFRLGPRFQSPSLWWPADRACFVHTEIDGTSTYIGGSRPMIGRLVGDQVLESFEVEASDLARL